MIQIAQDISSSVQVKKRRRCGHRRGFLTCTIGEIDKSGCASYFPTESETGKIPSAGVCRADARCSPHTTGRCQLVRHGPQAGHARLWDVALYCFCVSLMVLMYVWSFLLVGSDYASLLMRFLVISRIAAPTTRIPPMM